MSYKEFQAKIDTLDKDIERAKANGRSVENLYLMRKQLVEDWQRPAES
jgi:hypothetical protein